MRKFYTLMMLFALIALAGFAYPESVPLSKLATSKTTPPVCQAGACAIEGGIHV